MTSAETRAAAELCLAWLAATDPLPAAPVDVIIGFGVFDLSLPRFCGELFTRGHARHIIFTGGLGAGTGTLGGPEADVWRAELRRAYPPIPDSAVILENRSTNTGDNLRFTADLLRREHPALAFGSCTTSALIVASPSRLRRVQLTLRHLQPSLRVIRTLPLPVDLDREAALYAANGVDYLAHLAGELDRIVDYPARGWIATEPLPPPVAVAHRVLRDHLRSGEA